MKKVELLEKIIRHYWDSPDFNGYGLDISNDEEYKALLELVADESVEVIFNSDGIPNTFIKPFKVNQNTKETTKKLEAIKSKPQKIEEYGAMKLKIQEFCVYPACKILESKSLPSKFDDKPYSQIMAKGGHYFQWISFELSYLNYFRENPDYDLYDRFVCGRIVGTEENFFEMDYGISFDKETKEKYWGIFLGNLSEFSPRMQQQLKSHEVLRESDPHPEFAQNQMGHFYNGACVFEGILLEIDVIYRMTEVFGSKPLFKKNFREFETRKDLPLDFSYLSRPSKACFNNFCLAFCQVVLDNIEPNFFQNAPVEQINDQGQRKGSITMLGEFFEFVFRDNSEANAMMKKNIKRLRNLQKMRSKGAHNTSENQIDKTYINEQKKLLEETYYALREIRIAFSSHPEVKAQGIELPTSLENDNIYA